MSRISIIGGGPAGLRAAEVAASHGAKVTVYDAKPSVGRKLLVAGRGGLNLTHGEAFDSFVERYSGPDQPPQLWRELLEAFPPAALREWAAGLGIETFEQRTGRVYPREMKAAPLLRRWIDRLRSLGVRFAMNHRWSGLTPGAPHRLHFQLSDGTSTEVAADKVVLALGGASWSITGSDGRWVETLQSLGIAVNPLVPANCGWECAWPADVLKRAEGQPLKNIAVRCADREVTGELMITQYGLEGGTIYQLGSVLRSLDSPQIEIDLKPTFSASDLAHKLSHAAASDLLETARKAWKLSDAAFALLASRPHVTARALAQTAKAFAIPLTRPRPIDEAISSAGGVCWRELDEHLMLKKLPGVYLAGEMIDWEAPTGGYLMQGCFAMGTHVGGAIHCGSNIPV